MADTYGLLALPAPVQVPPAVCTDPGLEILLDWFRTLLNANLQTAWNVYAPGEPIVRKWHARDPAPADFAAGQLPALFCWRDTQSSDQVADDVVQDTSSLVLLWVYPPTDQFKQAVRMAVQNGLSKSLSRAVFFGRDPSWFYKPLQSNIIRNPGFTSPDTYWTLGAGWTIPPGGVLVGTATNGAASQADNLYLGETHRVIFTVGAGPVGSVRARVGTTLGIARSTAGTFTQDIVCAGNEDFALVGTGFTGTIDNCTCAPFRDPDESSVLHGSLVRAAAGLCRKLQPDRPFARAADLAVQMSDGPPIKYPAIKFGIQICEELTLAVSTGSPAEEALTDYDMKIYGRDPEVGEDPLFEFDSPMP